jgi:OMF family outer membrane factor
MTARILAILCALVPATAIADGRPLTLENALDLARSNNRDLVAARAVLDQSRGGVDRAFAALLPTAGATGIYTHNYKNVTYANLLASRNLPPGEASAFSSLGNIVVLKQEALQASLNVNVPIAAPASWFSLDAAKQTFHAAEANLQVTQTQILFSAAQAYFAAAGSDELLQTRRHAIEVAHATLGMAEARLHAGTVNRQEVTRAQLALVNAEQAEREAEDTRDQSYRSLATIIGLRESFHVVPAAPAGGDQPAAARPSVQTLAAEAMRLRPEIGMYDAEIQAAGKRSRASLWQWAPTLAGFGALNGYNYAGLAGDKYAWDIGLQLNWAIYDGGVRDAARREADAARAENESRLAQLRDTVRDDIANATRGLETKRMALITARQSVALATETLEILHSQYEAGTALQLDVLQAQDAVVSAEVQQVQARFDLALADLALQRDVGTFPGASIGP